LTARTAEREVAALGALYTDMMDVEERELVNPCTRVWKRRKKLKGSEDRRPTRCSATRTR
jgi:hypothetical protein